MGKYAFSQEPAVWMGLVAAVIGLVVVFFPGLLTTDQQKAILGFAAAAIPVAISFVVRSQVTPVAKAASAPAVAPPAA